MKKILIQLGIGLAMIAVVGCTQQTRAKKFGGTATIDLPAGRKLVTVTWKGESHIWYLTRPMTATDTAETYEFKESSSWGFIEGTVVIKETKK